MHRLLFVPFLGIALGAAPLENADLQRYFETKGRELSARCLTEIDSLADWEHRKPVFREQLFEMLGLSPRPEKTSLEAQVTGTASREDFIVEKLHFQSMPGLYVTANLYLPRRITEPLPAILYLCGHGQVKTNGISYGNKVTYQHHGAWFARNGYACLLIDTVQLGEIEGLHHGTHRENMWWWNSRGYTPAGVEAWNCLRALDYLETRPEVDKSRFGVTGRSGGGAYSWWITALDERIKVSAPVAGITDLEDHLGGGVVDGHCDCMYFVNTWQWDYPLAAALAAPRPLLIANSDKDSIFPLGGVIRTHAKVKSIYDLYGASGRLGLLITEGPHRDTQDLQLPVFRWFNRHLKGGDPVIEMAAAKFFTPAELKVFDRLPADERASRIHESFVRPAPVTDPAQLRALLRERVFGAWPKTAAAPERVSSAALGPKGEIQLEELSSEPWVRLSLYAVPREGATEVRMQILDPGDLPALLGAFESELTVPLPSRPSGPPSSPATLELIRRHLRAGPGVAPAFLVVRTGGDPADAKKAVQIRRRHMLLGETLDSARVWDIVQGVRFARSPASGWRNLPVHLAAEGRSAASLLMAAAVSEQPFGASVTLVNLPADERTEPDYLNFRRFTTLEDLARIARSVTPLEIAGSP